MNKDLVIFDWEVFPEWNCMVWGIYTGDDSIELHVISSDDDDYLKKLRDVNKLGYLCGFNIKSYDMQIYHFAVSGWSPEELYDHSQQIINSTDGKWKSLSFWRKYEFTDLYDDIKTMGSLKQFESNTGLSIHESTIPFGKLGLTSREKQEIIEYCKDDVRATNKLAKARHGYLEAKANCAKLSPLDEAECMKNTAAKLCAKMLYARQEENPNLPYYNIPDKLEPIFRKYLHPTILEKFDNAELTNDFAYEVTYLKNHFTFGAGGVHSTLEDALLSVSDDDYILVNADFENLYPSLLVNFEYYATGVPEEGKELFRYLLKECRRLKSHLRELKKAGQTDTEEYKEGFALRDSIKLILNASTGAMRNKYSPLYDPQNIISLCMTGQLLTTCMAKIIHSEGGLVLQSNTDGVLFRIKRSDLAKIEAILKEFSEMISIPLEVEEEYSVFQKDVNNYILFSKPNGKPKLKGRWAKESGSDVPMSPLNAPIINQAIIAYYNNGTPIEDTIRNCKDPLDFMMTTMKGPTYSAVLYADENGERKTYNVNRVYATTNKKLGTLYKIKIDDDGNMSKHDKIASIPDNCRLHNEEVTNNINSISWDLDYDWYIKQANDHLIDMKKI